MDSINILSKVTKLYKYFVINRSKKYATLFIFRTTMKIN
jgi:hypothetical protein